MCFQGTGSLPPGQPTERTRSCRPRQVRAKGHGPAHLSKSSLKQQPCRAAPGYLGCITVVAGPSQHSELIAPDLTSMLRLPQHACGHRAVRLIGRHIRQAVSHFAGSIFIFETWRVRPRGTDAISGLRGTDGKGEEVSFGGLLLTAS